MKMKQYEINKSVENGFDAALKEYETFGKCINDGRRLRSCNAEVIETENYYILRSYRTKVAAIDKRTDTLYDALRLVYGCTSTSAQHISKFKKDYGSGKWGCANEYRWY